MKERIIEQMALVWLHVCIQELIPVVLSLSPCQTRDDFLGQVDVPLNQIPVSLRY